MVLAAGLGTRMRPVTDTLPKPLIEVNGRALIDHALDRLQAAGVTDAVVNTHHLADQVEAHLKDRTSPAIKLSPEKKLLETGGGIANALALLGAGPFFTVNADTFWLHGPFDALGRLADTWADARMDAERGDGVVLAVMIIILRRDALPAVPRHSANGHDGSVI